MNALNQIGAGITVDENGLVYFCKRDYIFQHCDESLNLGNSGGWSVETVFSPDSISVIVLVS